MYAKHGNLVDADASGINDQTSTKHLESRLDVIQGHAFWDHWKPTRDCVLLYDNVGLESEISKERSKHLRFENPTVVWRPISREPLRIFAQALYF